MEKNKFHRTIHLIPRFHQTADFAYEFAKSGCFSRFSQISYIQHVPQSTKVGRMGEKWTEMEKRYVGGQKVC